MKIKYQILVTFFSLASLAGCKLGLNKAGPSEFRSFEEKFAGYPEDPSKAEILYGRTLFMNSDPEKTLSKITGSKMSCTNCHLNGGTKPLGLPLYDTHGIYPQYRSREGRILTLPHRINGCLVHAMNGKPLEVDSREMNSMLLYIRFLGADRKIKLAGDDSSLEKMNFPEVSASPERGAKLYQMHCSRCHGENGRGKLTEDGKSFLYPPVWGSESYLFGSSMSRVSIFARFIKVNMPFDLVKDGKPVLTDQEALDIAAFVNTETLNARPIAANIHSYYPDPKYKPFDFSYGPYDDNYSSSQHKYGPFNSIIKFQKEKRSLEKPAPGDFLAP